MCRFCYLSLLVSTQLKVLAPFQGYLFPVLTLSAFHTENNFLGCFSLKIKRGLWAKPDMLYQNKRKPKECKGSYWTCVLVTNCRAFFTKVARIKPNKGFIYLRNMRCIEQTYFSELWITPPPPPPHLTTQFALKSRHVSLTVLVRVSSFCQHHKFNMSQIHLILDAVFISLCKYGQKQLPVNKQTTLNQSQLEANTQNRCQA